MNKDNEQDRIETGSVEFEDDWPGIFIRGDNAMYYSMMLKGIIEGEIDINKAPVAQAVLRGLYELLTSSNVNNNKQEEVQKLKTFTECVRNK